jgi:cytochrome P450
MFGLDRMQVYRWAAALAVQAIVWLLWIWHRRRQEKIEAEERFARQHDCQPLRPWNAKWPLGLDMLAKVLRYAKQKQILKFFVEALDETGTTFEQNLLGARAIGTIDPRNIEAILSTNFDDYSLGLRKPTFQPLLGSGIFTQDGPAWAHSRRLIRPQFSSNRSQNFEQVKKCVQAMIDAVPASGVVDLQPLCFKLTFDTTMFLLFGDSVLAADWGEVAGQESEFAQAFNLAQDYLSHRGRLGAFYWLLGGRKFTDACDKCHRFIDAAVSKALETSARGDNKVREEVQGEGEEKGSSYVFVETLMNKTRDPQVIRDQCLNLLLAGRDTTGCCLQWTLYILFFLKTALDYY